MSDVTTSMVVAELESKLDAAQSEIEALRGEINSLALMVSQMQLVDGIDEAPGWLEDTELPGTPIDQAPVLGYPYGQVYPYGIAIRGGKVKCYGGYHYWGGEIRGSPETEWITIENDGDWLALNLKTRYVEHWPALYGDPEDKPKGHAKEGIWRGLFRFSLIDTGEIDESGWDPVPLMIAKLDKIGWLPSDIAVMRPEEDW